MRKDFSNPKQRIRVLFYIHQNVSEHYLFIVVMILMFFKLENNTDYPNKIQIIRSSFFYYIQLFNHASILFNWQRRYPLFAPVQRTENISRHTLANLNIQRSPYMHIVVKLLKFIAYNSIL